VQSLEIFLENYKGKLLVDLAGTTAEECVCNIKTFQSMMSAAVIFVALLGQGILAWSKSCYEKDLHLLPKRG
jgi:hypothetical protein